MRTVAVIPCLNEERFIGKVVAEARKYVDIVIVADDHSDDKTQLVATEAGAVVFRNGERCGFGGNVRFGINASLRIYKPDIIVTIDGDGQHIPSDIYRIIEPIIKGEADVVVGSRFMESFKGPLYRSLGIKLITWLYNVGHKAKITDGQSCLRAYRVGIFKNLRLRDNGFGFSTEILIKTRRLGYTIMEVPITCIYHKELKVNSTMNPIKQGISVALSTIRWRMNRG